MSKVEEKKEEVERNVLPYVPFPSLPLYSLSHPPSSSPFLLLYTIADPRNVFFDIDIAGEKAGRIIFKLYDDIVPKVRSLPAFLCVE